MELEDEADVPIPERHPLVVGHPAEAAAVEDDLAALGTVEAADQVQQRALADAAGADDRDHLATLDRQRQITKHVDVLRADAIALVQGGDFDEGHQTVYQLAQRLQPQRRTGRAAWRDG